MTSAQTTLFASEPQTAVLHFDGGSRGNPGPAAWGYTLVDSSGEPIASQGRTIGIATNNEAEYGGLIAGLARALDLGVRHLAVHGDSKLVIEQMAGRWRVKAPGLQGLSRDARDLSGRFASITFQHVRRALNSEADRLVNAALDEAARSS